MAISKIIYKQNAQDTGTVWMDTTQKTVTSGSMLSGTTALKNDGTDITGNIASKTSSDLTANVLTVTAPAGHYASAATKTLTDQYLLAENIKKDISIFGVTGTYEGGGGLEYETGTWTPTADIAKPTINFTNTHTNPPVMISLCDATGSEDYITNEWKKFVWLDVYQMRNSPMTVNSDTENFATAMTSARSSATALTNWTYDIKYPFSNEGSSTNVYYRYWVTNTGFSPSSSTTRYYCSGRTYKWIAVWAPTT